MAGDEGGGGGGAEARDMATEQVIFSTRKFVVYMI